MSIEGAGDLLFADFVAGREIGARIETLSDALLRQLRDVYGSSDTGAMRQSEAATLAMVMMMRAYLAIVSPRPPGNIHARQRFKLESLPAMGEALSVTVSCLSKEIRRERRYVDFEAVGTGADGRRVFSGILTLVWAA